MYLQNIDSAVPSQRLDLLLHLPAKRLDLYLEQVAAVECSNPSLPYLAAINPKYQIAVIWRPRCKNWGCLQCGPINQATWSWRAANGVRKLFLETGQQSYFTTLTSHEMLSEAATWRVWPNAWDKLRKRVKRQFPKAQYFAVPEAHQSGRLHMHMITTAPLSKRWWKDNGRACGLGYMADVQELENAGSVAAYVSKYLTKTLENLSFARGFRRVRTSHGWPKLPEETRADGWTLEALKNVKDFQAEIDSLHARGFDVVRTDRKKAWKLLGMD